VLAELRDARPDLVARREVHVDGGVTRGTDVLKALCLGARGVGLGRAFLYGNALWGADGCRRVIESEWRALRSAGLLTRRVFVFAKSHAGGDRDGDAADGGAEGRGAPGGDGAVCGVGRGEAVIRGCVCVWMFLER
jgi:hypothetical protein